VGGAGWGGVVFGGEVVGMLLFLLLLFFFLGGRSEERSGGGVSWRMGVFFSYSYYGKGYCCIWYLMR